MKKRILLMAAHFHPYKGGLENFALDLGCRLAERGTEVDVFTFNLTGDKDVEKYKGLTIYRFPSSSIMGNTYTFPKRNEKYKKMLSGLMKNRYDAVVTNTRFFTTSYLGLKYSRKMRGTKFIHIEHGNVHVIHSNPLVTLLAWIYDQTVGRMIFRGADAVVGISGPCADFAKRLGARKTMVIHNSLDPGEFTCSTRKRGKKPSVIYVGRLIYAKGVQDLLEAVRRIKDVKIIIVGDGPYRRALERKAKDYKLDAEFTGTLNRSDIKKHLCSASIFVNPSYSEGLPTSILEAGAAGLPIIATDVGGTSEIITDRTEGILIQPKDVDSLRNNIEILLKSKAICNTMSKNISARIRMEFSWDRNIRKFEALI